MEGGIVSQDQQVPTYVYGPETTLGGLFQAYFTATNTKPAALAKRLGLHTDTIRPWLDGVPSASLTSSYKAKVEEATGIDLDRWMMIEAKRQILAKDPALAETVTYDRFVTRKELIEELSRQAKKYGGNKSVADQLGVTHSLVGHWLHDHHLPADETLRKVILGVATGFIQGNRNDVLVRVMAQRIFGRELPDLFPGADGIIGFTVAFLTVFKGKNMTDIERLSGVTRNVVKTLYDVGNKPNREFTGVTLIRMFRTLVRKHMPDRLDAFDAAAKQYAADKPVKTPVFAVTKQMGGVPPSIPATPAPVIEAKGPERGDRLESKVDLLTEKMDRVLNLPSFSTEIGATIDGIENCLSSVHHRSFPHVMVSNEELGRIKGVFAGMRKMIVMINGLDGPEKRRVINALADEIDEMMVGFVGTSFYNIIGSDGVIEAHRDTVKMNRNRKRSQ